MSEERHSGHPPEAGAARSAADDETRAAFEETEPGPGETLAAELLARRAQGEEPDRDALRASLPDEAERRLFDEALAGAENALGLLPRQVREGTWIAGRYRVLREIGHGGMGKVFAVHDRELKREVALKVLSAPDLPDVDLEALFRREAELLAKLQHPGIVPIHEVGRDGDVQFLVMDLVEGASLKDVLERVAGGNGGRPPRGGQALLDATGVEPPPGARVQVDASSWLRSAARIGVELARTVEAAHARGVVHRDLKPGNVLIRGDGVPVVLDFGLAGVIGTSGVMTRRLYGSASYVAPEQVRRGATGTDPRTDVYQLGLILYELLTLEKAFDGESISDVLSTVESGRFAPPRRKNGEIPADLEDVVLKALERDPERRYATMQELREDLELFLEGGRPPRAARGGPLRRVARRARYAARRRPMAVAAPALMATGLVLGVIFLSGAEPQDGPRYLRYDPQKQVGSPLDPFDVVRPGEFLGFDLEVEKDCFVYALSVFGTNPVAPERLTVLSPVRPEDVGSKDPPRHLELKAGPAPQRVYCARIDGGDPEVRFEGLLVIVAPERDPVLESWLDEIDRQRQARRGAYATREDADRAVAQVGSVKRGVPLAGDVPAAERKERAEALNARLEAPPREEDDDGKRWYQSVFRLAAP